jgi:hypothetical protein
MAGSRSSCAGHERHPIRRSRLSDYSHTPAVSGRGSIQWREEEAVSKASFRASEASRGISDSVKNTWKRDLSLRSAGQILGFWDNPEQASRPCDASRAVPHGLWPTASRASCFPPSPPDSVISPHREPAETMQGEIDKAAKMGYNRQSESKADGDAKRGSTSPGSPHGKYVDPVDLATRLAVSNLIDTRS